MNRRYITSFKNDLLSLRDLILVNIRYKQPWQIHHKTYYKWTPILSILILKKKNQNFSELSIHKVFCCLRARMDYSILAGTSIQFRIILNSKTTKIHSLIPHSCCYFQIHTQICLAIGHQCTIILPIFRLRNIISNKLEHE